MGQKYDSSVVTNRMLSMPEMFYENRTVNLDSCVSVTMLHYRLIEINSADPIQTHVGTDHLVFMERGRGGCGKMFSGLEIFSLTL